MKYVIGVGIVGLLLYLFNKNKTAIAQGGTLQIVSAMPAGNNPPEVGIPLGGTGGGICCGGQPTSTGPGVSPSPVVISNGGPVLVKSPLLPANPLPGPKYAPIYKGTPIQRGGPIFATGLPTLRMRSIV